MREQQPYIFAIKQSKMSIKNLISIVMLMQVWRTCTAKIQLISEMPNFYAQKSGEILLPPSEPVMQHNIENQRLHIASMYSFTAFMNSSRDRHTVHL